MTYEEGFKLRQWLRTKITTPEHPLWGPAFITLIRRYFKDDSLWWENLTTEQGREFARYVKTFK